MMSQPRLVTIGIPTYNRAEKLRRAIESVLSQDYPAIEVLISDNSSTDGTQEMCRQFCERDNRINYIRQADNIGAAANFEYVLQRAAGEYFMWLGDDDWIDSTYIASCVSVLDSNPDYALVSGVPHYYNGGELDFVGKSFDLIQDNWAVRVMQYYRRVADNGLFYGVMQTNRIRLVDIPNTLGGDWHLLANIVSSGKVKMLSSTSLYRDLGGATNSYLKIVQQLGLPRIQAWFPMFTAACGAWKEIVYSGQMFKTRNMAVRLVLANVVFVVVNFKYLRAHLGRAKRFLLRKSQNTND